jgi:hypothetical protein
VRADTTGKISLDHIYTEPDPRAYFSTLRELDYNIPELAKPHFSRLVAEYRNARRVPVPTVVDIGCSYGINAALLKFGATMDELYDRYGGREARGLTRGALLSRDRELARSGGAASHDAASAESAPGETAGRVRFIGLDASENALSYALEAGFLDGAVHADLEDGDPTADQAAQLARADLVVSTGCLGYVTERTIARVVEAAGDRRPWMAHFILRMFPFDPIADTLAAAGYETVRREGLFRQRRFATDEEQAQVLETLADAGVDPSGVETGGWLYAGLYVSRPRGE